ncbi:MAG TPA: hypothetical protein VFU49_11795 [Ktedonobacteraceae bacterium]|nr:hypothetical protein [Ktedonobacteraceae bacterium]
MQSSRLTRARAGQGPALSFYPDDQRCYRASFAQVGCKEGPYGRL